jgi:hypothetical protein
MSWGTYVIYILYYDTSEKCQIYPGWQYSNIFSIIYSMSYANIYDIGQQPARPGASIPSDASLSISIKIKKTPLISAEKPTNRCRYKGGHFEITNFIYFEYSRGISEQSSGELRGDGGGTRRRRRGNSEKSQKLYVISLCYWKTLSPRGTLRLL